ncbi:MAG: hypothetical protein NUV94_08030 [Candidatus Acetothermia bacterium]|jgi:hypothetical protein|nr:hypothetical protein [Candidatus Acetothermia bacterium]
MRRNVGLLVVALALFLAPVLAQTSASVAIRNDTCTAGVQLSQIVWVRGEQVIGLQLLQVLVRMGQTYTSEAELSLAPTSVVVRGLAQGQTFEVAVPMGETAKYTCGTVTAALVGQPAQPGTPGGQPEFPAGMPRPNLSPGMSPAQLLANLQAAGAQVEVQGSEASPKLGDAADPILVGAFPSGFSAQALWVSAGGSLRVAVTHDRPSSFIWLWVVPVPNFWNTATAWSPLPGALTVSVDRPQALAPFTQWGDGPVPGVLFFVLVIKWDLGPAMPFVLSLSQ